MPFLAVFIPAMFITGGDLFISIVVSFVFGAVLGLFLAVLNAMSVLAGVDKERRR